jgi:hypothetical protein
MVMLASDFDKSRFLKAADLPGEKKFRIKSVTAETVGMEDEKKRKPVLWFTNDERGLLLNTTNLRTLSGAFGDNMEAWVGKIIIAFPTHTDFCGKLVPALRVRIPPPKQTTAGNGQVAAAAKPAPAPVDDGLEIPPNLKRESPKLKPVDPELDEPPAKPAVKPSLDDELDDEIPF